MQDTAPAALALYLDLLKRSLSNTLFGLEPDADAELEARYVAGFIRHYIEGAAVSMLPLARFDNIQSCVLDVIRRGVPGDLIETGVWRGGATIFMRAILKACGETGRTVWVADSFEGLPEPDAGKVPHRGEGAQGADDDQGLQALRGGTGGRAAATSRPTACWTTRSAS